MRTKLPPAAQRAKIYAAWWFQLVEATPIDKSWSRTSDLCHWPTFNLLMDGND
jgi:hypothetical protein